MIQDKANMIPLADVKKGDKVKILAYDGGRNFKEKLISQGMLPGTYVTIVSGGNSGPFILEINGTRIILGHSMVERIFVEK